MDERIVRLAWNIIEEHNTITELLTVPPSNVDIAVLTETRRRAMEFVARLLEQTIKSWGVELK